MRRFDESRWVFGEPVFAAAPGAEAEDGGVLLTVATDASIQRSALFVLPI